MKKNICQARLRALREHFNVLAPDTVWILQTENRYYLSGYKAADFDLTESSGSLLINADQALLITDSRYTLAAEKDAEDFEVITHKKGLLEIFPELLARLGTKNLGFEESYVTLNLYRRLAHKLRKLSPPVRLTPLKGLIKKMREVKDPAEIRQMAKASEVMSQILGEVIEKLKPGCTEKQIAWQIEDLARAAGADSLAFPPIIASGPNSALPHAVPGNRKIREREPIIMDVGIKWNGYCCDMTRTVFIGEPRPKFKKIYSIVRKAQLAGLATLRANIKSSKPDTQARQVIADSGFGEFFGHSLGHGVGLATHEPPYLSPLKSTKLLEGMVVTVEPGIYIPNQGGVRLENMVVVTKDGCKILTTDQHIYDFA